MRGTGPGKPTKSIRRQALKGAAKPNLPQHNLGHPYSRLMGLGAGDYPAVYDETAAALKQGNAADAARQLLRMVEDQSFYDYDEDDYTGGEAGDPRGWTRLHALRILSRMGDDAHVAIDPLLPLLDTEDDYLREDIPFYYASMGAAAIEPLARTLTDPTASSYRRSGAGESLAEIGERFPDQRNAIIPHLEQTLIQEQEDTALTGFLIINLCDLAAKESISIIEQAYRDDRVDETIVSLAEVQEHFGMPVTAQQPRWQYGPGEPRRIDEAPIADSTYSDPGSANTPYVAQEKVGRNDPCPCGSGKKYKKCCGSAV